MDGFFRYCATQAKRVCRLLPALQISIVLMSLCLGIAARLIMENGEYEKAQIRFEVGLVGNTEDSYLGFGYKAIQSVDTSRYMVHFQTLTQEEANQLLLAGKLSCYLLIPDGLMESLVCGRNDKKVECVTDGWNGIFIYVAEELTDIVSTLILRSQSAVFGMQEAVYRQGVSGRIEEYTDGLTLRFFDIVLDRTELCELEELGVSCGISTIGYYLCGGLILFMLLCGIIGGPLFAGRNGDQKRLAASKGISSLIQVAGEYLAWAGMNLLYLTEIVLIVGILWKTGGLKIEEWEHFGTEAVPRLWLMLVPVSLMFSALQFLLYELTSGVVGSILLQFVSAVVMGYLAGCFYPYTFFPDILQRIGECLPAGAALRFVQAGVSGRGSMPEVLEIAAFTALYLGLSVAVRKQRIERGR